MPIAVCLKPALNEESPPDLCHVHKTDCCNRSSWSLLKGMQGVGWSPHSFQIPKLQSKPLKYYLNSYFLVYLSLILQTEVFSPTLSCCLLWKVAARTKCPCNRALGSCSSMGRHIVTWVTKPQVLLKNLPERIFGFGVRTSPAHSLAGNSPPAQLPHLHLASGQASMCHLGALGPPCLWALSDRMPACAELVSWLC